MDHTLFTYRNLEELRKIQEEREVFAFIFGETKDMLDSCSEVCIDISAFDILLVLPSLLRAAAQQAHQRLSRCGRR